MRVAFDDDVPIAAGFAKQDVAQGAADEVGLLLLGIEVLSCAFEN